MVVVVVVVVMLGGFRIQADLSSSSTSFIRTGKPVTLASVFFVTSKRMELSIFSMGIFPRVGKLIPFHVALTRPKGEKGKAIVQTHQSSLLSQSKLAHDGASER